MVERHLAKVDVAGPTPVFRLHKQAIQGNLNRFFLLEINVRSFNVKLTKEFTNLEKSSVRLTVTVAKKDVQDVYAAVTAKYVKNALIPGFRKGHVPPSVLERKFGDALKSDAMSELIDKSLNEAFEKETENRPLPYRQPVMDKAPDFDLEKDFTYEVTYDIFPKISIKDFSGIVVKVPVVKIGDAEIQEELKAIQERNAVVMDKKDGESVENDNIITINYSELDEAGNEIAETKRDGFIFTVGTGENIYKIDDEILGMKKGETKQIVKKYDDNDSDAELAGKTKKMSVTVAAIKIRKLPEIDDELAQDVSDKYKTLDDLKKHIKESMEQAKNKKIEELKSNTLLEQLIEKNNFDIPVSMLEAELDGRWRMMAQQLGTSIDKLEKLVAASGQTKESMLESWTGDSEKMLKSRIIVDHLIKERNIAVTPDEIEARCQKIADESDDTLDEVKKHYADPRFKEYLIDDTKEQKLYEDLYKEVKVEKGASMTFSELFQLKTL